MVLMPFDDPLWFRVLAGLMVGLALGSFITMLSYRAPRRLSIVMPPSHCPKCNTLLAPLDLIPVLSWLISRGRCRHCGVKVSARYVVIELVTAWACVLAFIIIGLHPRLILAVIAIVSGITLVVINVERRKDG